jgi:phosphohistidine phosphatase
MIGQSRPYDLARLLIASGDVEAASGSTRDCRHPACVIDFAAPDWGKVHPRGGRLERFVSPRSLAAADRV